MSFNNIHNYFLFYWNKIFNFRFGKRSSSTLNRQSYEPVEVVQEYEPEVEKLFRSIDTNGNF
jgi:hypothetical protein